MSHLAAGPSGSPPSRWKPRVLAALLGTAIALAAFVAAGDYLPGAAAAVGFQRKSGDAFEKLIDERRRALESGRAEEISGPWKYGLTERIARMLFPMGIPNHVPDPYCYFRHESQLELKRPWADHPRGVWYWRTNALGLREDGEVLATPPDVRILVTGDSHTDGVCENSESYSNVLESALARAHPGKTIEVLNAGKGGYSFYNYFGVLERFLALDLKPRVFVVGIYAGNDFDEMLTPWHYFEGTMRAPGLETYYRALQKVKKINDACLAQGMMSIKYFKRNPEELEFALDGSLQLCGEMLTRASGEGTSIVFVYIPSPYELRPEQTERGMRRVLEILELDRSDIDAWTRFGDRFVEGLQELGATVVDLRPEFRAYDGPLFWNEDHHINVEAHALIARQLQSVVEKLAFQQP